jgi:predicted RND superfamily exporter protein
MPVICWRPIWAPSTATFSEAAVMSKFDQLAERIIFGNRALVLAVFALVTVAMAFFASQLKVDAGFNKQVPLQHEYMRTFTDYQADFGGANRVLIAVMAKDGNMFSKEYMATLENITNEVINLDATDDAKARSLFTPNVRFIEVVEDGLSGGNVIPPFGRRGLLRCHGLGRPDSGK